MKTVSLLLLLLLPCCASASNIVMNVTDIGMVTAESRGKYRIEYGGSVYTGETENSYPLRIVWPNIYLIRDTNLSRISVRTMCDKSAVVTYQVCEVAGGCDGVSGNTTPYNNDFDLNLSTLTVFQIAYNAFATTGNFSCRATIAKNGVAQSSLNMTFVGPVSLPVTRVSPTVVTVSAEKDGSWSAPTVLFDFVHASNITITYSGDNILTVKDKNNVYKAVHGEHRLIPNHSRSDDTIYQWGAEFRGRVTRPGNNSYNITFTTTYT